MGRVNSKLQVTIPKALADRYGIRPGDHIRFEEACEVLRVVPVDTRTRTKTQDVSAGPARFDAATAWQRARKANQPAHRASARGWDRESRYARVRRNAD